MNVLGYFIYKFKCRDSSGNFSIPLKTEFVDARGTAARMFKKIRYGELLFIVHIQFMNKLITLSLLKPLFLAFCNHN